MKLDYFTLLSPDPLRLNGIGSIKSPKLEEISKIGYWEYQRYTNVLLMDIDSYYNTMDEIGNSYFSSIPPQYKNSILKIKQTYQSMSVDQQEQYNLLDVIIYDPICFSSLLCSLNFFFVEEVIFDPENNIFKTYDNYINENGEKKVVGIINSKNFEDITSLILERICIKRYDKNPKKEKIKNKTAKQLLERMNKANTLPKKKEDKKLELPNLISSLASHHNSLNMTNIWNLTVYQLYDQFNRTRLNDWSLIHSTSVSVWGDKDKKFNGTEWMTLINEN